MSPLRLSAELSLGFDNVMGRLKEFLSEDSNQYGPGTDLMVSLMSILLS